VLSDKLGHAILTLRRRCSVAIALARPSAVRDAKAIASMLSLPARGGENYPRSEMLLLEEEQGSPALGTIERTMLDQASVGSRRRDYRAAPKGGRAIHSAGAARSRTAAPLDDRRIVRTRSVAPSMWIVVGWFSDGGSWQDKDG
jgi:hypothetical protein